MSVGKQHSEFYAVDMNVEGWRSPPGYPEDIQQKILAGSLDETNKTGNRTRLLRFKPGAFTTEPFVHDYWEEVYLISGEMTVGDGDAAQTFRPNTYACRPPGIYHGPFRSNGGCVLLEFHYYEPPAQNALDPPAPDAES
jgi:mannose-6-phosphate isomerase-like protein (cupin superfamily)